MMENNNQIDFLIFFWLLFSIMFSLLIILFIIIRFVLITQNHAKNVLSYNVLLSNSGIVTAIGFFRAFIPEFSDG